MQRKDLGIAVIVSTIEVEHTLPVMQALERLPAGSGSVSGLVYYIDLMNWLLAGNPAVEVFARGQSGKIKESGNNSNDVTWAIVTFSDGAVVNFGVCVLTTAEAARWTLEISLAIERSLSAGTPVTLPLAA